MLDGTTYVVRRHHVRGLLSMGCGSFPVALYLATGKGPDKDKSDFFVNPTGALGLLVGNPIPQSRDRCFLGSSPRRLGAYLPERKPRFP